MKEEITVGFGGNVSSHQANQLYLGLGYQYLGRFAADVNSNFQVGNSFSGVMLSGRMYLQTQIPTYLNWQGVFSDKKYTESQSLFYEDIVPAMIKQKELYMKLKFRLPLPQPRESGDRVRLRTVERFLFAEHHDTFPERLFRP